MPFAQFGSVQLLSRVQLFATPWTAAWQASLSITNSRSPPKPMSIELVLKLELISVRDRELLILNFLEKEITKILGGVCLTQSSKFEYSQLS